MVSSSRSWYGRMPNGRYLLVAGERRWRASALAGKKTVPVVTRKVSDEQALEITIVENLQRENLNAMEQARAFERLGSEFRLTQEQIAERTGKDRTTITNFIRLLKLPSSIQAKIESGELTFGHAKALMALNHHPGLEKAAQRVVALSLSVRQTESLVQSMLFPEGKDKEAKPEEGCRSQCEGSVGAASAGAGPEGEDRGQPGPRPRDHRVLDAAGFRYAAGEFVGKVKAGVSCREMIWDRRYRQMTDQKRYFLASDRIGFRCWSEEDLSLALEATRATRASPEFIGGPFSAEQIRVRLGATEIALQREHNLQYWPLFLLHGDAHVGCCGLRPRTILGPAAFSKARVPSATGALGPRNPVLKLPGQ